MLKLLTRVCVCDVCIGIRSIRILKLFRFQYVVDAIV